jgi:O-antigen ligase/tetratricopeptide (TPR) repeat protein
MRVRPGEHSRKRRNVRLRQFSRTERLVDSAVTWSIAAMIIVAPLRAGSADHDAFTVIELVTFALVLALMLKTAQAGIQYGRLQKVRHLWIPASAILAVLIVQLIPLPPSVLFHASRSTYQLYVHALPGWPISVPYQGVLRAAATKPADTGGQSLWDGGGTYRTLSIAPWITRIGLLKLITGFSLFALILLDDFAGLKGGYKTFYRTMLIAIFLSGLFTTMIAFVSWTSQVGNQSAPLVRASGPFANADHFACFISMILPLAAMCAIFKNSFFSGGGALLLRALAGGTLFAVSVGLVLAGSRGGWAGAIAATAVLLLFWRRLFGEDSIAGIHRRKVALAAGLAAIIAVLAIIGAPGRGLVTTRILETIATPDISDREGAWKDTLPMLRDFPLFGVGLGCWSEIFPRYSSPPWVNDHYFEATHNDFLELLAEIGILGFAAAVTLVALLAGILFSGLKEASEGKLPILLALIAAIIAVAFEEVFDFGLQVPATAVLFVVLFAMAVRIASEDRPLSYELPRKLSLGWPAGVGLAIVFFGAMAAFQFADMHGYVVRNPREARGAILADPATPDNHLSLIEFTNSGLDKSEYRRELETLLWIEPSSPYTRDAYVARLLTSGERNGALAQIRTSFQFSPVMETHRFSIPPESMSPDERLAAEQGLRAAIALGYVGAVQGLGDFLRALGRIDEVAKHYEASAKYAHDHVTKSKYFLAAGQAYSDLDEPSAAEKEFRAAVAADPNNQEAYLRAVDILVRENREAEALALIESADLEHAPLYIELGTAERNSGKFAPAESAVGKVVQSHPEDRDALRLLGDIYRRQEKFPQSALMFRRASELAHASAEDFFNLGVAEEAQYNYAAADTAFQHAISLAPRNPDFRDHYHDFKATLNRNKKSESESGRHVASDTVD